MKAAEKEVEFMEKKYLDNSPSECADEKKEANGDGEKGRIVSLPSFKQVQEMKRKQVLQDHAAEEHALKLKVTEAENHIESLKKRIKALQESPQRVEKKPQKSVEATVFPPDLLAPLANLIAQSGSVSSMTIVADFCLHHGATVSKKLVSAKIDEIARKEKREEEGDRKAVWHLLPEYTNLLTNEMKQNLSKPKEARKEAGVNQDDHKMSAEKDHHHSASNDGALGPDGDFVQFPHYDGLEEPREAR